MSPLAALAIISEKNFEATVQELGGNSVEATELRMRCAKEARFCRAEYWRGKNCIENFRDVRRVSLKSSSEY